jgi:hypothetical protein
MRSVDELEVGSKYKIRYRIGMQRNDREAVMVFLGKSETLSDLLLWSARPVAGTQSLYPQDIKEVEKVASDTVVYINRIIK